MPRGEAGTVYLIHFERPYRWCRHYVGWTKCLKARLAHHRAGTGARLLQVLRENDIGWELARAWRKKTRAFERGLKKRWYGPLQALCPACRRAANSE